MPDNLNAEDERSLSSLISHLPEFNRRYNPFDFELSEDNLRSFYVNLKNKGVINGEEYPQAKDAKDLKRFVNCISLLGATEKYFSKSFLEVINSNENNRLGLSLNNACEKLCSNCASNAKKNGPQIAFSRIAGIDRRFIRLFRTVGFGLEGEPFFYRSEGKDLSDVVKLLHDSGINNFDFLTGGFFPENSFYEEVIGKLKRIKEEGNSRSGTSTQIHFNSEMTYNHYVSNLEKNAVSLLYSLERLSRLNEEISIKVVGDLRKGKTNVYYSLQYLDNVLAGNGFSRNDSGYDGKINGRKIRIKKVFPSFSYPVGRYKIDNADNNGKEGEGRNVFPLCRHLGYDEVFIDCEGGLRFCAEVIAYDRKTVTNIFENSFDEVLDDLDSFHKGNYQWLRNNLRNIIQGKERSCMCMRYGKKNGEKE